MVDWLSDHLLVGRSQKENAAVLREMLVKILSNFGQRRLTDSTFSRVYGCTMNGSHGNT